MTVLMLWIAAVFAVAAVWWFARRPASPPAPGKRPAPVSGAAAPIQRSAPQMPPVTAAPAPVPPPAAPIPPALAAFQWITDAALPQQRREQLLQTIRGIPRPPQSMQQLLSPDFLARAGSAELSQLIMAEPIIAAKVLSAVNSPMYGLRQPVASLGQAVTFLGINSVRNICLQYMLAEAFKPKLAEAQKAFDRIWKASACASELAVRLGKALHWSEQGSLSTQVVLSFVGQLAMASMLPAGRLTDWLAADRLGRARLEQELIGISAVETGALMMRHWGLPASLVEEVADIGRVLITPAAKARPERAPMMALGYLCARLGECLANGRMEDLDSYQPATDGADDAHHLRSYLTLPSLARLDAALQSPELRASVDQMLGRETPA